MFNYILQRIALMIPTLLGILTITFLVIQFVPGGPVEQLVQQLQHKQAGATEAATASAYRGQTGMDAEKLASLKKLYGFDKPWYERYGLMLKNYATFNLGESYFHQAKVTDLIWSKLPVSISLGIWTFLLSYWVSIPLGIAKAMRNGSRFDSVTTILVLFGYAVPGFLLGIALLVLFGGGSFWQLFPLSGMMSDNWADLSLPAKIVDYLWHMVLPVLSMTLGGFAVITLLTKNVFLEEINRQYVLTARAKGLSEKVILYRHILKNAAIPLLTGFPAAFVGAFFTGSLLVETVFSLDGLGLLSYDSVVRRDYPVVMGSLFIFTLIGLFTKLITDISYALVDPRVNFSKGGR